VRNRLSASADPPGRKRSRSTKVRNPSSPPLSVRGERVWLLHIRLSPWASKHNTTKLTSSRIWVNARERRRIRSRKLSGHVIERHSLDPVSVVSIVYTMDSDSLSGQGLMISAKRPCGAACGVVRGLGVKYPRLPD
jgi:hypothetical protein